MHEMNQELSNHSKLSNHIW